MGTKQSLLVALAKQGLLVTLAKQGLLTTFANTENREKISGGDGGENIESDATGEKYRKSRKNFRGDCHGPPYDYLTPDNASNIRSNPARPSDVEHTF